MVDVRIYNRGSSYIVRVASNDDTDLYVGVAGDRTENSENDDDNKVFLYNTAVLVYNTAADDSHIQKHDGMNAGKNDGMNDGQKMTSHVYFDDSLKPS